MHYEKMQDMSEKKAAAVGQSDAERHGGKKVVDYGEDGTVHLTAFHFLFDSFSELVI